MDAAAILQRARQLGVTVVLDHDRLRYNPREKAPAELVEAMRKHKEEIITLLGRETHISIDEYPLSEDIIQERVRSSVGCSNPITPHSTHELPWECDPDSCFCFKHFGYPRLCQGVPCRWVFPLYKNSNQSQNNRR